MRSSTKQLFLTLAMLLVAAGASAFDYRQAPPVTIEKVSLDDAYPKATLCSSALSPDGSALLDTESAPDLETLALEESYFKTLFSMDTPDGVHPYRFIDDLSFAGVPVFVAGIIAKSEKKSFRQDYNQKNSKTRLVTNFHSEIDNYTQFAPFALSTVLNVAGVKGRSKFGRYAASSALSFGVMALFVNSIKYTAKEMRPDGSTANSWPSGHTATAFTAATILHKEYGMTRSPWFSVGAYAVATATGAMRVLNNRHWVSDVLSGAGIGIMSTELGYAFADLLFKGKGLNMNDLNDHPSLIDNPSFFSINMGIGLGNRDLSFGDGYQFKFRSSTAMGVEGAYFLNPYIGIGGRLRVKTSPIGNLTEFVSDEQASLENISEEIYSTTNTDPINYVELTIESDHLAEFNGAGGLYFSLPLSDRFALGSKLLVGYNMNNSLDVKAEAEGSLSYSDKYSYYSEWDYLEIKPNNSMSYGTGLSLTYAYKSTFSWKAFVDYDYSRKTFELNYDPNRWAYDALGDDVAHRFLGSAISKRHSEIKKDMHSFVIGGAFVVSF